MSAGRMRTQVAVIGSGPGGAVTAAHVAEAGRAVLLLEEGPELRLDSCPPFTRTEMEQKYRSGGITVAVGNPKVAYVEGRCLGGGSEINSGLYHRTPPDVLETWRGRFGLHAASAADMAPHFQACEEALSVAPHTGPLPPPSLKLEQGAAALGWASLEVPRWIRDGRRQSMTETFVPRAQAAGCTLQTDTRVVRLRRDGGRWTVLATHAGAGTPPRPVEIDAETVFVCAGAVQTAALLRRSGIGRNVGGFGMHPTIKVVAVFPDEVNAPGLGVAARQVKQFAPRVSFGCSISSPAHLALFMLDHPAHASEVDRSWRHMAIYYASLTGGTGSVRPLPGFADPLVRYALADAELAELRDALVNLGRCLFAAGAIRLYPSIAGGRIAEQASDLETWRAPVARHRVGLMSVHLFSSCPMGENPAVAATDSFGRVHGVPDLHVGDASLLPTAPGVNPQGTVMAFARRNALAFVDGASR